MKRLSIIMLFSLVFGAMPGKADTNPALPVCYWQLQNEERYIYRWDMDHLNWQQIRNQRELNATAAWDPKLFELKSLGPEHAFQNDASFDFHIAKDVAVMMRDPNGRIHPLPDLSKLARFTKIPNSEGVIGRYLLGAHVIVPDRDVDGNGVTEDVHLCAKHMMIHFKNGARMGRASVVFFDDPEHLPLEIGPDIDTAKSRFGGSFQTPHSAYDMLVKYRNKPLAGCRVTVIAEGSQWQRSFLTDARGRYRVMPTDDRFLDREWQKYLYMAVHTDQDQKACYVATLPVVVYKNQPEWRSKAVGFTFWAIMGCVSGALLVLGLVKRKHWQDRRTLMTFNNYSIKTDRP